MADKGRRRGHEVPGWQVPPRPDRRVSEGRHARLEPLEAARHARALHAANRADDAIWDYMPYGPFATEAAYRDWITRQEVSEDPLFFAIIDRATGAPGGVASYLRIAPEMGSIELGHICLAPGLQGTRVATEAFTKMIGWAFEHGYRRFEWKCDALNLGSRRAAERLGLSFEGIFRQAAVVKGRNRDTAWFAAIDSEWPALRSAYAAWLAPVNFDEEGRQRQSLSALTRPILVTRDPALAG